MVYPAMESWWNRGMPIISWQLNDCLLYTSDAADDLLCVDLGGRRIIKKKKTMNWSHSVHTT